jgi:hypothetical protein
VQKSIRVRFVSLVSLIGLVAAGIATAASYRGLGAPNAAAPAWPLSSGTCFWQGVPYEFLLVGLFAVLLLLSTCGGREAARTGSRVATYIFIASIPGVGVANWLVAATRLRCVPVMVAAVAMLLISLAAIAVETPRFGMALRDLMRDVHRVAGSPVGVAASLIVVFGFALGALFFSTQGALAQSRGLAAAGFDERYGSPHRTDLHVAHEPDESLARAWHANEAYNQLLWEAGKRPDLCGISLIGTEPVWVGPSQGRAANYVIAPAATALAGFGVVAQRAGLRLWRREGPCGPPPPGYSTHFGY